MDKDKIIESLQKIIDDLKSETENKFELRYWDNDRPKKPDMVSNDFLNMRRELYNKVRIFHYAELKDAETNKVIIKYEETDDE